MTERFTLLLQRLIRMTPGLAVCTMIAGVAMLGQPWHHLPPVLVALLAGMLLRPLAVKRIPSEGIDAAARGVLQLGVVALGARMTVEAVSTLGTAPVIMAVVVVTVTTAGGYLLGRALGLTRGLALTASAATGICGSSAALAVAATLPESERRHHETVLTVVGVTSLSTIAMVAYPALAHRLGIEGQAAGLFLGAAIHNVPQVVGAGALLGETALVSATYIKMLRVALLAPVVVLVPLLTRGWQTAETASGEQARSVGSILQALTPPMFVVAFLLVSILSVAGWLPPEVTGTLVRVSKVALIIAIAGLGMKTRLLDLTTAGKRALLHLVIIGIATAGLGLGLAYVSHLLP